MATARRRPAFACIYLLAFVAQCSASAGFLRQWHGKCNCRPVELVPIARVFHRHHPKHKSLWQWYETRKRPHQDAQGLEGYGLASFLQEKQLPDDEIAQEEEVPQGREECPCAEELYWAINTQKTVLSIIGSLEEEKQDLEHTEKALAAKAMAELHLKASHIKVGATQKREDKAEDDIALEAADLEQAQEATLATQDSTSGGNVDSLQQDTAAVEQTDQLADIQSQQLDADVLEKKVALEKINHIALEANVHVADMEVKSKLQSADIHEDRVPTELEINQAIRMLEEARPRVQTEEAQLVVEQCMHELKQALGISEQVTRLEMRIELQVSQNPELQPDSDEDAQPVEAALPSIDPTQAGGAGAGAAGAYPDAAVPPEVPPEQAYPIGVEETPALPVNYWASDASAAKVRTRTSASRKEQEQQLRRQIRGTAKRLVEMESRLGSLDER